MLHFKWVISKVAAGDRTNATSKPKSRFTDSLFRKHNISRNTLWGISYFQNRVCTEKCFVSWDDELLCVIFVFSLLLMCPLKRCVWMLMLCLFGVVIVWCALGKSKPTHRVIVADYHRSSIDKRCINDGWRNNTWNHVCFLVGMRLNMVVQNCVGRDWKCCCWPVGTCAWRCSGRSAKRQCGELSALTFSTFP